MQSKTRILMLIEKEKKKETKLNRCYLSWMHISHQIKQEFKIKKNCTSNRKLAQIKWHHTSKSQYSIEFFHSISLIKTLKNGSGCVRFKMISVQQHQSETETWNELTYGWCLNLSFVLYKFSFFYFFANYSSETVYKCITLKIITDNL